MKLVIQRVKKAHVSVNDKIVGAIENGYTLLVGIEAEDTPLEIEKAAQKIVGLRVFDDTEGKMNLDIKTIGGSILSISQFTLAADIHKGNRPSFIKAMNPESANELFELFNSKLREHDIHVETGIFQTEMQVHIQNDGPVTIVMEVKEGKVQ